jgi:NAD(P) transhydrogenase subunit alpha
MVEAMAPGSVVVDLAAATGGNCEVTVAGETIVHEGVTVMGPLDLASRTAGHASDMYSRNVVTFVQHLTGEDGMLALDWDDEITAGSNVTHDGKVTNERIRAALEGGA